MSASAFQDCSDHCSQDPTVHRSSGGSVISLRCCLPLPFPFPWFPPFCHLSGFPCCFLFCHLSILLSVSLCGMMCSSVSNTVHDVSCHTANIEASLLHGSNSDVLSQYVRISRTCGSYQEMHKFPSVSVQRWFSSRARSTQSLEQHSSSCRILYLLTSARQASNPSPSLLVKTIFNAFPRDRSLLQHSSTQHLPSHRVADPTWSQWLHLQVVPPLL